MKHVLWNHLKSNNALLLSNINQGFQKYPHKILQYNAKEYLHLIQSMTALNSPGHSYVDFYFGQLSEEEKKRVLTHLNPSWQSAVTQLNLLPNQIYFQIEDEKDPFLEILSDISSKELLFSTFYFTRYPCTLWTNYNLSYPLFFYSNKEMQYYESLLH